MPLVLNPLTGQFDMVKTETDAGGVSDGDKGDITVSGSGSVWTIDDDVVAVSKLTTLETSTTVYVATTGSDTTGVGSSGNPWATVQKAINECPLVLPLGIDYIVQIADGTYTESSISIDTKLGGGRLVIRGNTSNKTAVVFQHSFTSIIERFFGVAAMNPRVDITHMTLTNTSGVANGVGVMTEACAYVFCSNLVLNYLGDDNNYGRAAIWFNKNNFAFAYACEFNNCGGCIYAREGSNVLSTNHSVGTNNDYALIAQTLGRIVYTGTQPTATNATYTATGGSITT